MNQKTRLVPAAQLALNFEPALQATLGNFFPGEQNRALVERIRWFLNRRAESQLLIYGDAGSGKTHLLQGACWFSQDSGVPSMYLPLKEIIDRSPQLLQGLDYLGLICIDDVDAISGKSEWENALLALLTRIKSRGGHVIVAAADHWFSHSAETTLKAYLKSTFLLVACHALSQTEKQLWIEEQAMLRGLLMSSVVSKFLVKQFKSEMPALVETLLQLEQWCAGGKRKLTVPQVKSVLSLASEQL